MEEGMMVRTETVEVWVPIFDYGLCRREFGFAVIGQTDKRRASFRCKVEKLAKDAVVKILAQLGLQILEIGDCGHMGYDCHTHTENYLAVRVRAVVEIPEDVVACAESLKHLSKEVLLGQVQRFYDAGDKQHARKLDICAILLGDWFDDGYCLSWSAIYRQLCIQIRGLGSAYISRKEFLTLAKKGDARPHCARASFLHRLKALFRR
jgi:hypothetical protein